MLIALGTPTSTSLVLAGLLVAAVATDLRSRRIPNLLVVTGLSLAAVAHGVALATGGFPMAGKAWWSPLAGLITGGIALMPLYALRACGAGDVKLMAMAGAFLGAPVALRAVLFTLLAGGLLSLLFMLGRGVAAQTFANIRFLIGDWMLKARGGQGIALAPLATTAARLPYSVAISAGTLLALLTRPGS